MFIYQIMEKKKILKLNKFTFVFTEVLEGMFFLIHVLKKNDTCKMHIFFIICNIWVFFSSEKLTYIFQKLDFIVRRYDNLEDVAMYRRLVDVSLEDHSNYDCFVCCILSHGVLQNIYGTNGRLVRIAELTGIFRSRKCTGLAGKPKLFFIQACQGREKQMGNFTRHFYRALIFVNLVKFIDHLKNT